MPTCFLFKYRFTILNYVYVCGSVDWCVYVSTRPMEARDIRSPEAGVTGNCEPYYMRTGDQPWKNSIYSEPVSHLFCPYHSLLIF